MPKVNFRTDLNNIEIIPCIDFNTIIHKFNSQYTISITEGISISSPTPEYLEAMFDSGTIKFSGICVYLNEEGKSLCGSKNSISIKDAQNEDINANTIVITTGIHTTFSIPSLWTNKHYLYFIMPNSVILSLSDVSTISYYSDGIKINEKCSIIAGKFTIDVPTELAFNVDLPKGYPILSYMYNCYLYCGINEQTSIFLGYISGNQIEKLESCINIGGYDSTHKLTVYFNNERDVEELSNLANLQGDPDGLDIKQNDEKKHLCICKDESCNKCKEGIEGNAITYDSINSDPGNNVDIRVFMDVEVSSSVFSNKHNVYINSLNNLIVNDVQNVYQNIENKLKVDNLIFTNVNNLIIKPKQSKLYITMAKQKAGLDFTIEMSNYLILSVQNVNENGIVASKINVKGNGELNIYDYPYDKIEADSTIKVIKGIYIICDAKADESACLYDETLNDYKIIEIYSNFVDALDKDTKIIVILDTYSSILDVDINDLNHQQLIFIKEDEISSHLLENDAKIRFLSTSILTNKADFTTNIDGSQGGISLSNDDSNYYIVAFDDKLTIKQEGDIETALMPIVIQPQTVKASIVIDKNVNLENQKLKIKTEIEKLELTVFVGDKPTNDENINKFIDVPDEFKDKVNVIIKEGEPEENPPQQPSNGLKTGQIVGIVVGVVAFVAIVIVIVIIIIKKKKNNNHSSTEVSDQE